MLLNCAFCSSLKEPQNASRFWAYRLDCLHHHIQPITHLIEPIHWHHLRGTRPAQLTSGFRKQRGLL